MTFYTQIFSNLTKNKPKAEIKIKKIQQPQYFHLTPNDKLEFLNNKLKFQEKAFLDDLEINNFEPINFKSSTSFYTYGVITTITGANKKPEEIFLQNTLDGSNDLMKLNLTHCESFSLFQGAIVAIKGINPYGNELIVEKIFSTSSMEIDTSIKKRLRIVTSKGPFLEENIHKLLFSDPELLILLGPFCNGKSLNEFVEMLDSSLKKNMFTQIILVPSLDDDNWINVLPQIPIFLNSDRVFCVANPGLFSVNNHYISVCNFDSLMDLSTNEFYKENNSNSKKDFLFDGDRSSRLCKHLIFQRSFLPVFPSSLNTAYGDWMNVDIVPAISIISSKMNKFERKIGPSHVINVGNLAEEIIQIESMDGNYIIKFLNK